MTSGIDVETRQTPVNVFSDEDTKACLIIWEDSQQLSTYPWMNPEEFEDGMLIYTVGWLIGETDRSWFVAMGISSDTENTLNNMSIPKSCVIKMVELETKQKE